MVLDLKKFPYEVKLICTMISQNKLSNQIKSTLIEKQLSSRNSLVKGCHPYNGRESLFCDDSSCKKTRERSHCFVKRDKDIV